MRNKHVLSLLRNQYSRRPYSSSNYKSVIGLEVHAQLNTKSKLFSGAENTFGGLVNNNVSYFDASIPGTLPVLNRKCVELGIKTALALSCQVNEVSSFDRKHYFYADMPAGYQITQQRAPLASNGVLNFQVYTPGIHKQPYRKSSRIKQIQLEQDSGKSLHYPEMGKSLVDLNRAGAPLMELVFEPDLEDGEEAAALVKELVLVLQRLGACQARLEEGGLRVDANVSVHRPLEPHGVRTEIKNIGSVRGVAGAVKFEAERQMAVLAAGGVVRNETRTWDAGARVTLPMRDKEQVQDYRYMPEPNLPPLRVNLTTKTETQDILSVPKIQENIPELPEATRKRLIEEYTLTPQLAIQIVNEPKLLDYFMEAARSNVNPTKAANFLINDLLTVLNRNKIDISECVLTSTQLVEILKMLTQKKINLEVCKKLLEDFLSLSDTEKSPEKYVVEKNWMVVSDDEEITKLCKDVIDNNPKLVKQYKDGKRKVFKSFLGIIAKGSKKNYDMAAVSKRLEDLLK